MLTTPNSFDLWLAWKLAWFESTHPRFTSFVQGGIVNCVLGGIWFAAALFVSWVHAAKGNHKPIALRVLTICLGSALVVLLLPLFASVIAWPPPVKLPAMKSLFPEYLRIYAADNSFPSRSTALYSSVAAGVYSMHRLAGTVLWCMVVFLIALPRMYVGGHYFSDVLAGILVGSAGYLASRSLVESRLTCKLPPFLEAKPKLQFLMETLIFLWIFEVATEFRIVVWVKGLSRFL